MHPFKNLTKAELVTLLLTVEESLDTASAVAHQAGKEYSTELQSQLAFEVGHLSGSVKQAVYMIANHKNC